ALMSAAAGVDAGCGCNPRVDPTLRCSPGEDTLAHFSYTHQRLTQLADRFWGKVYTATRPVDAIEMSERCDRIPYAAAQKLPCKPAAVGAAFGPVWATYWFKVAATVPAEWAGKRVDLLWNSRSEATLWIDG